MSIDEEYVITWTEVPGATGYRLYHGPAPGEWRPGYYDSHGPSTGIKVIDMAACNPCFWGVRAYNADGEGPISNILSEPFPYHARFPFEAWARDDGRIEVQWRWPELIAQGLLSWGTAPGSYTQSMTVTSCCSVMLNGLAAGGTTYYLRMTAVDSNGASWTSLETWTTLYDPAPTTTTTTTTTITPPPATTTTTTTPPPPATTAPSTTAPPTTFAPAPPPPVTVTPPPAVPSTGEPAGGFHSVTPARVLDTRNGIGTTGGALGPGSTVDVQLAGRSGVPPSGAIAAVVNVTAVDPTSEGFLTTWPAGGARPQTSSLNFVPGQNVANLVTVPLGAGGAASIRNEFGSTHVLVDVVGWYDDGSDPGDRYNPVVPVRIMDTRRGLGVSARFGAGQTQALQVTGRGGVPSTDVSAVVLNLTADAPTSAGFVTAWPHGQPRPEASNLNLEPGVTVANLVTVGVDPATGRIDLYNAFGSTDLIADVVGWYGADGAQGSLFHPVAPDRVLDTRPDVGLGTDEIGLLVVAGVRSVPADATAVVANVTATRTTTAGFLTVWPYPAATPDTSNVNWRAGRTVPNLVIAPIGAGGVVGIANAFGHADVLVDVMGYFAPN